MSRIHSLFLLGVFASVAVGCDGCGADEYYCDDTGCYECDGLGCRPVDPRPDGGGEDATTDGGDPTPRCEENADCGDGQLCGHSECRDHLRTRLFNHRCGAWPPCVDARAVVRAPRPPLWRRVLVRAGRMRSDDPERNLPDEHRLQ